MFADFMKYEFNGENMMFWQACEELKQKKNHERVEKKAQLIYEDFIALCSTNEVRLLIFLMKTEELLKNFRAKFTSRRTVALDRNET